MAKKKPKAIQEMAQTLPEDTRAQFVPFLATLDAVKEYLTISADVMQIGGGLYFPLTVYREIQYTEAGDVLEPGKHFFDGSTEAIIRAAQIDGHPLEAYHLSPVLIDGEPLVLGGLVYAVFQYMPLTNSQRKKFLEFMHVEDGDNITAEEVRAALPQLSSIIPQKHVMPNNKLANSLTKDIIDAGAIDLVVSGRGKSEITTRCILSYEGDNVKLSGRQPCTEYDRNVADAVTSLFLYGDPSHIITPATVYRAMIHSTDTETPSPQTLGAVTRSLDKGRFVRVQIDCTQELLRRKASLNGEQITGGKVDTYLLPLEKIEVMAGGKKVTAYKIIKTPVLYDYAMLTKQVLTVPAKLLDVPNASNSEQRISIKGYLLRRVTVMKGKTAQSNRILFAKICEAAGKTDPSPKEAQRIREYTFTVLDYWKKERYIKGYKAIKEGKTYTAVEIQL